MVDSQFRTPIAENIFRHKYAQGPNDSWDILARRLVEHVCGTNNGQYPHPLMSKSDRDQLTMYIKQMKFIPGGRYLYYAGRPLGFFNNCFALKGEEDTREEWGNLMKRGSDSLMSGGGIGVDYSIFREEGRLLKRTGGISSGPIPLMQSMNEMGRNVMQGGSRRSALFASLNWQHGDIQQFLHIKDWSDEIKRLKANDFNFPAPLDMTNISINWDDNLNLKDLPDLWHQSVQQMCKTGEPGHCYNFGKNSKETLRNACSEFTAEEDSSVCNLGSINFGAIEDIAELSAVVELAAQFLYCGTIRGDLPYDKVKQVRDKNRDVGLGLMGLHEWLLKRGKKYEVDEDLKRWLEIYQLYSEKGANAIADRFYLPRPRKYRAVAPAGTIGILALN